MTTSPPAAPPVGLRERKRLEVRPAPVGEAGAPGGSRRVLWMRARDGLPLDVGLLSIYADFVSIGIETALGAPWKGSSLDNTIRVRRIMPADWVLCDIAIQGVHAGIAHGDMRIFTPDGELIAVASQSMIVRRYD